MLPTTGIREQVGGIELDPNPFEPDVNATRFVNIKLKDRNGQFIDLNVVYQAMDADLLKDLRSRQKR